MIQIFGRFDQRHIDGSFAPRFDMVGIHCLDEWIRDPFF